MTTRPIAWLLGATLVLGACAGGAETAGSAAPDQPTKSGAASPSSPSAAPTSGPSDAGSSTSPDAAGPAHESLAFEAPLLDGGTFDGAVSGDVVLWFWAPW